MITHVQLTSSAWTIT